MRVGEHTSVPQAGQRNYGTSTLGVSGGVEDRSRMGLARNGGIVGAVTLDGSIQSRGLRGLASRSQVGPWYLQVHSGSA